MDSIERNICEDAVFTEYNAVKTEISANGDIICQQIGTFTQDILISFVSILEHQMTQHAESTIIQKRLIYLVIECIQNIIYHSDRLPDNHQLAYVIVSKNSKGYYIHSSNSIESKNVSDLTDKVDVLLKSKKDTLANLFTKKIKKQEINNDGHAGIGLLTMVSKSGKNFSYKVSEMTSNYSLFHIEININYKNIS